MFTLKDKVLWFALCSRICIILMSIIFNVVIPDHSADAFVAPRPGTDTETFADCVVKFIFGGLLRWDAQYFIHIAMYGYTYENCLAFFPLFPLLTRVLTQFSYIILGGILNEFSVFLISSAFINLFCFVKAALFLFELSLRILKTESLAYKAAILFCVNPASIFFSAPYSESLFTFLSFWGLLKCGCGFNNKFSLNCGIVFGLSAMTRSNGILNIGFIAYECVKSTFDRSVHNMNEMPGQRKTVLGMLPIMLPIIVLNSLPFVVSSIFAAFPFVSFQLYGYLKFCTSHNHSLPDFLVAFAHSNNLVLPGNMKESFNKFHWCGKTIPLSYSYVQSHYWDVGFLQYYTWKQIPNFLLATPVILIILSGSYRFFKSHKYYCLCLGLNYSSVKKKYDGDHKLFLKKSYLSEEVFPYVVHVVFLVLFSMFCAHIQITTRLISSSSPVLYWLCAEIIQQDIPIENKIDSKLSKDLIRICKKEKKKQEYFVRHDIESLENMSSYWKVFIITSLLPQLQPKLIQLYFVLFTLVGTILFSNFLPWT